MATQTEQNAATPIRTYWYFHQAQDGALGVVGFVVHADHAVTIEWLSDGCITMARHHAPRHPLTLKLLHTVHIDRLHQKSHELRSPHLDGGLTYRLIPVPNQRKVDAHIARSM